MDPLQDLQQWFWDEIDRNGYLVVHSIVKLVRATPTEDMPFVGLQVCTMLYQVVNMYGPSYDIVLGISKAYEYMNQHPSILAHPTYREQQMEMKNLLESFQENGRAP